MINRNSVGQSEGIVVFIESNIIFKVVKHLDNEVNNFDTLDLSLLNLEKNFDLLIIYCRPYGTELKRDWMKVLKLDNRNKDTILVSDFNAHDLWEYWH